MEGNLSKRIGFPSHRQVLGKLISLPLLTISTMVKAASENLRLRGPAYDSPPRSLVTSRSVDAAAWSRRPSKTASASVFVYPTGGVSNTM